MKPETEAKDKAMRPPAKVEPEHDRKVAEPRLASTVKTKARAKPTR